MDNTNKNSKNQDSHNQKNDQREPVSLFFEKLNFQSTWITGGADKAMIAFADKAGKYMAPNSQKDKQALSKSQIRNVFGEMKRIQLKWGKTSNINECISSFMLLKPKVAYAEGRNKTMGLSLFKKIFDEGWGYVDNNRKNFNNFCALLEAILAYHKAYGGKD